MLNVSAASLRCSALSPVYVSPSSPNVARAVQVDKAWPLGIDDHAGSRHEVTIVPGQMVMYEGASCAHNRETEFIGDWFANIFIHFSPLEVPIPVE